MSYKLTSTSHILRIEDGACIPQDIFNNDYCAYLAWAGAGNTPEPYVPPPTPKVTTVSMKQARLALLRAGKYREVQAAISEMDGQEGEEARIIWEFSAEVSRTDALVVALTPALKFSDAELDGLFALAATL